MQPRAFLCTSRDQLAKALRYIGQLPVSAAAPLEVSARTPRKEKTPAQRKLFHAVCSDAAVELGLTPMQVKHAVKIDFYGEEVFVVKGVHYAYVQDSEDSERDEYSRLIDHAYLWAAERGVVIPDRRPITNPDRGRR